MRKTQKATVLVAAGLTALLVLAVLVLRHAVPGLILDSRKAYVLASPDRVEVFQTAGSIEISTNEAVAPGSPDFFRKAGSGIALPKPSADRLTRILMSPRSYHTDPRQAKASIFAPELVLSFWREGQVLDIFVCLDSADVLVKSDGTPGRLLDVAPVQRELKDILGTFVYQMPAGDAPEPARETRKTAFASPINMNDRLIIPLAYKYVAIVVMLAEVNHCASKLQLPMQLPIDVQSLHTMHVSKPFITGFGGTLETAEFSFVFFKSGRLRHIERINRFERGPLRELQWRQSGMRSLINTNEAYQLATNWLEAISVDVPALEQKHKPSVAQTFFYPDAAEVDDGPEKRQRIVLLPIFHVCWGDPKNPAVMVSVFGPTEELLGIYQDDESFSRRPKALLRDTESLLAIPDSEFRKYSPAECQKLVARFAEVRYGTSAYSTNLPPLDLLERRVMPKAKAGPGANGSAHQ